MRCMARSSTSSKLAEIAPDQWGLVTRRQAEEVGISRATMTRVTAAGSLLERVGTGVYHLVGAPIPDQLPLRVAWLQLAPEVPAWRRTAAEGVVSHRSAAALYGLGHLPADQHEFTVPARKRSRRPDVRLHVRKLGDDEWITLHGLPVTRPSRIASDLLADREEPGAVAQLIADAIRNVYDYPGTFADALASHAARFGFRRGDGLALLRSLLDLVGDPESDRWLEEARAHVARGAAERQVPPTPATSVGQRRDR
jgi:predicted transcriptional regulator of viral defense system